MRDVIFESVEMKNFRSHEYMTFDFTPNRFVIISGENGQGKSTLFDAITYAAYDMTTKKRKGDSVIRKRVGKDCSVIFKFSIGEDRYEIQNYRKDSKFNSNKFLFKNDNDISGATRKETNTQIEILLGTFDVFMNCIMFSRHMDKSFAGMTDKNQKDIFDMMMGFEKYYEYYELFKDEKNRIIELKEEASVSSSHLKSRLSEYTQNLEFEERTKDENLIHFENDNNQERYELDTLVTQLSEFETKVPSDDFDSLIQENLQNKTRIETEISASHTYYNHEIDNLIDTFINKKSQHEADIKQKYSDSYNTEVTELNTLKSHLDVLTSQFKTKRSEIENSKLQELENTRIENENVCKPIIDNINQKNNEVKVIESQLGQLNSEFQKKSEQLSVIQDHMTQEIPKCYACKRPLEGESLQEIQKDLDRVSNEYSDLKEVISQENDKLTNTKSLLTPLNDSLNEKNKKYQSKSEEITDRYQNEISQLNTEEGETTKEYNEKIKTQDQTISDIQQQMTNEISVLESEFQNILNQKKSEVKEKWGDKIEQQKTIMDNYASIIDQLQDKKNEKKTIVDEIERIKNSISIKEQKIESLKINSDQRISELRNRIFKINEDITALTIEIKKIDRDMLNFDSEIEIAEFWKKAFGTTGIKSILLDEAIPILNEKAKELSALTEQIRVRFDSTKMIGSGESRNKFSVLPIQTKNLTDDIEDFSSGESRLVDIITLLSLRNLLEKMHNVKFNVILFDEVLDSLDPSNVDIVLDVLQKLSQYYCVGLITHTLRGTVEADEVLAL